MLSVIKHALLLLILFLGQDPVLHLHLLLEVRLQLVPAVQGVVLDAAAEGRTAGVQDPGSWQDPFGLLLQLVPLEAVGVVARPNQRIAHGSVARLAKHLERLIDVATVFENVLVLATKGSVLPA